MPNETDRYHYAPVSSCTDASWDDSFDSDFDDDEVEDISQLAASAPIPIVIKPDDNHDRPPPVPPRDYLSSSLDSGRGTFHKDKVKPKIFPVVQNDVQLSHTHYFLIPSHQEQEQHRTQAAVKPFNVYDDQNNQQNRESYPNRHDYQNLNELDPKRLSTASDDLSWMGVNSTRSGWKIKKSKKNLTYSRPQRTQQEFVPPRKYSGQCDTNMSPREKVYHVMNNVMGVTDEECHAALCHSQWRTDEAVKFLKVEQLFRLGVATRKNCEDLLDALNWDLELASSAIMDQVKSSTSVESAV